MALRTLAAALTACALIPATALASPRPNFPKKVSGSITGSSVFKDKSSTVQTDWSISGVRFKLIHIRSVEGSWTGFYKVTGGTVSFKQVETGTCGYTITEKFSIATAIPKNYYATPLALTRALTNHDTYDGDIDPPKKWNIMETCDYPDQDPVMQDTTVEVPDLFSTGEKATRIGRAMKGKFVYVDDAPFGKRTTTYKWSLKPR